MGAWYRQQPIQPIYVLLKEVQRQTRLNTAQIYRPHLKPIYTLLLQPNIHNANLHRSNMHVK